MKTCPKCSKEVLEDAVYCQFCGVKLGEKKRGPSGKSGLRRENTPVSVKHRKPTRSSKNAKIQPRVKFHVLVDGSNVIWYGGKTRLKNLQLLMRKLEEDGLRYTVFVDASAKYQLNDSEKQVFERMISDGTVQQVSANTPADKWILKYATNHPECRILSNDTFREWESKFPVIYDYDRFIKFMIVNDEVMLEGGETGSPSEEMGAGITVVDNVAGGHVAPDYYKCLLRDGVRRIGIIGYQNEVELAKRRAMSVLNDPLLRDLIYLERSVPITRRDMWGGLQRGIKIILRRRERPEREGKPTTDGETIVDELKKFYKTTSLADPQIESLLLYEIGNTNEWKIFEQAKRGESGELWSIGGKIKRSGKAEYIIRGELQFGLKGFLRKRLRYLGNVAISYNSGRKQKRIIGPGFEREVNACQWLLKKVSELERKLRPEYIRALPGLSKKWLAVFSMVFVFFVVLPIALYAVPYILSGVPSELWLSLFSVITYPGFPSHFFLFFILMIIGAVATARGASEHRKLARETSKLDTKILNVFGWSLVGFVAVLAYVMYRNFTSVVPLILQVIICVVILWVGIGLIKEA